MTIFLVDLVDTMFSKQNETEPMKPDCPPKRYGQVSIIRVCYTRTHVHTNTTKNADGLIALIAEQYRCQQTANDQWGKGMQTASYQAKRFIVQSLY